MVTRADLPPGTQACQAIHAACEFAATQPTRFAHWHCLSNIIVLLAAPDEAALRRLCQQAHAAGHAVVAFHEPDLDQQLTAAAFEPAARALLSRLPLALTSPRNRGHRLRSSIDDLPCVPEGR